MKSAMNEKTDITLTINGRDYPIRVEPRKTLVDAIRDDCGQTGTHIGCEHGVCGTCTVIVDDEAVRSCLMFAVQAAGKKIRTVEGLADGDKLSVLQQAFIDNHGLQCGYCTPGFLMLATNVLEKYPQIGDEELTDMLASNLCRCTGYQNIIKAVRAARDQMRGAKVTAGVSAASAAFATSTSCSIFAPPAATAPMTSPSTSIGKPPGTLVKSPMRTDMLSAFSSGA